MVALMTIQDLQTLLDYQYWARDRVLTAVAPLTPEQYLRDLGNSFKSIRDTMVHIYAAEWVWYSRWQGHSPTALLNPDDFSDVAALRAAWHMLEAKVREFVDSLGDEGIHRRFSYTLFSGATGESAFWQMLQHVVNHGSYHRGQVTTMLRQLGAAPPKSMDLIAFYRERGA
jgi:uncharacterized damage-inducible protein DinB